MSPLKNKVISEYRKMIAYMNLGKLVNYDYILDMISFLEVKHELDQCLFIHDYLLYHE